MANLLADPSLWAVTNQGGYSDPPAVNWTGSAYEDSWGEGSYYGLDMVVESPIPAGASVDGIIAWTGEESVQLRIGSQPFGEVVLYSATLEPGVPQQFSVTGFEENQRLFVRTDPGYGASYLLTPAADPPQPDVSYNCECDDDYPRSTLAQLRTRLLRRLGYSAQAATPPPGMAELLDDFLQQAQELLYRRYKVFRTERFFTWNLEQGVRFYDLDANRDACTKKLDPRKVTWVGISHGDNQWQPIACGIDPSEYTSVRYGHPERYEIRQCIEVWPYPADTEWQLRVKGHFGLLPFAEDDDYTTIDAEAVFLLALANAKAHEGQPDAKNYADQLTVYIGDLVAGSHHTRRYLPGQTVERVRPMPRIKGEP